MEPPPNDRFGASPLRRNSSFRRLIKAWASGIPFQSPLYNARDRVPKESASSLPPTFDKRTQLTLSPSSFFCRFLFYLCVPENEGLGLLGKPFTSRQSSLNAFSQLVAFGLVRLLYQNIAVANDVRLFNGDVTCEACGVIF
ncbi:hypothetical protein OUZ56_000722 [Daphnia magna]|uniref:Uncharacterized protein n=1 Tax=Daphnia magna TaxID=35525 RepID=A0ABR0A0J2_9CRUS|nr:hypothetical protein OUZ56_000722 [Daphnia magna]